jgi:hypothetical protein
MASEEDIATQQTLLAAHRQTLGLLLAQEAQLGPAYAPPAVGNGIRAARSAIAEIKRTLRGWGANVEDLPNDSDSPAALDDTVPRTGAIAPSAGGDLISANIGAGAQANIVGKNQWIEQAIAGGSLDPEAERRAIDQLLAGLESALSASSAQLDSATLMMASFQLRLLVGELGKSGERAVPSASTVTQVADWLLDHVPPLSSALTALFTAPPVMRALRHADTPLDAWLQLRFGS